MSDDLIEEARRCAKAVYLACDAEVASDIARIVNGLADEIERLKAIVDAIPDKDDPLGWVQRQVDKVEMTAALDATGLLRDEYPDQMAARSCTCEPDAVCGAHRLLARYIELNAAFVQRGKERREVQAELRELRAALGGLSPEAVEWAVRIASSELLFTNPRPPASACPPEVRAQITGATQ